ncbi:MAG TPA: hypothetical protein VGJ86_01140 [Acidimicrobiales bacterium]|jgi:hypothetical protein
MALICIGSVRGAPGASTLAVLAAACWPRPIALIEADPAGGALAVRYRLGRTPGLAGLASLVRNGADQDALWQNAQMLPGELPVVVAPESGEVTSGILRDVGPALAAWCAALEEVDIIVDCGRLGYRDVNWPLAVGADETLVVARPRAEELYPAAHRLRAMAEDVPSAGMVLIGDRPHSPSEITAQLGVPVRGVVADDAWAAGVLTVGGRSRGLRRSSLVRSVRSLVDDLMYRLETPILESGPRPAGALPPGRQPAWTSGSTPAIGAAAPAVAAAPTRSGFPTSGSTPIVLPPPAPMHHTGPNPAVAPAAAAAAAASMPPPPMPSYEDQPPPQPGGLPPMYVKRSREAAARSATATLTGPNRRVPGSSPYPSDQTPPPPAYAAPRHAPPPPRPRTGAVRSGGPGAASTAPARPGSVPPPGRQRPMRPGGEPGRRRWGRDR